MLQLGPIKVADGFFFPKSGLFCFETEECFGGFFGCFSPKRGFERGFSAEEIVG